MELRVELQRCVGTSLSHDRIKQRSTHTHTHTQAQGEGLHFSAIFYPPAGKKK